MSARAPGLAAALSLLAACCAPSSAPAPAAAPAASAPSASSAAPAAPLAIDPGAFAADLAAVARPRDPERAPEGLSQAARYLESTLSGLGYTARRQPVAFGERRFDNVIAERSAGAGAEVVVVCAHYDAVAGTEGADDNASGTAGMLAVGRALASTPLRRTLRLIGFTLEEEGLLGSQAYVASLPDDERRRIVAVFNLEMIGYRSTEAGSQRFPDEVKLLFPGRSLPSTGDFIALVGVEGDSTPLRALEQARERHPRLKVESAVVPRLALRFAPDLFRSDHAPFWAANIPAVVLVDTAEFRTPHYHRPSDTRGTLDLDFARQVAAWVGEAVRGLVASGL